MQSHLSKILNNLFINWQSQFHQWSLHWRNWDSQWINWFCITLHYYLVSWLPLQNIFQYYELMKINVNLINESLNPSFYILCSTNHFSFVKKLNSQDTKLFHLWSKELKGLRAPLLLQGSEFLLNPELKYSNEAWRWHNVYGDGRCRCRPYHSIQYSTGWKCTQNLI